MDSVYTFLDPARGFLTEVSAFLPRLALALLMLLGKSPERASSRRP